MASTSETCSSGWCSPPQYGEANFLFSSEINANSKIIYNRDPLERVQKAAPFLTTDTKAVPGGGGRAHRLDRRRLHHGDELPVRPGGHALATPRTTRWRRAARPARSTGRSRTSATR